MNVLVRGEALQPLPAAVHELEAGGGARHLSEEVRYQYLFSYGLGHKPGREHDGAAEEVLLCSVEKVWIRRKSGESWVGLQSVVRPRSTP